VALASWIALTSIVAAGAFEGRDERLAETVRGWTAPTEGLARAVSGVGGVPVILAVLAAAVVLCLAAGAPRRALALGLAVGLTEAAVHLTKVVVARPRPPAGPLSDIGGYSYPSAHAAVSVALYGLLLGFALVALGPRGRWLAGAAGVAVLVAIGASRVYLGAHHPLDVAGGWLTGAMSATAACAVAARIVPNRLRTIGADGPSERVRGGNRPVGDA
jgi:undecaprenyl-diphosphatase